LNKYPAECVKYFDYLYGYDGHMLMNFGIEGESYNMVDGKPTFTDIIFHNPDKLSVDQAIAAYCRGSLGSGAYNADTRVYEQRAMLPQQLETFETWSKASMERRLPPIQPTAEEAPQYATIMNQVNTYVDEMLLKFVMGQESLDKFDTYIANLESMGITDALKIQNDALARFNARQ
jgi:putative aldouronate transport system substrate-binding protein